MSKYQNGKIYIIKSNNTKKIYIGSTTTDLQLRLTRHYYYYSQYLREQNKENLINTHNVSVFQLLEFEDVKINLLYNFPCNSKKELEREEGLCILKYRESHKDLCVNVCVPGRTDAEYRLSVKDKKNKHDNFMYHTKYKLDPEYKKKAKIRGKKYREENKEKIKKKLGRTDCPCGGYYNNRQKEVHEKSKKHLFFLEHGKKSEDVKMHSIDCECGGSYMGRYKNHINYYYKNHLKTILHQTYLNNSN